MTGVVKDGVDGDVHAAMLLERLTCVRIHVEIEAQRLVRVRRADIDKLGREVGVDLRTRFMD